MKTKEERFQEREGKKVSLSLPKELNLNEVEALIWALSNLVYQYQPDDSEVVYIAAHEGIKGTAYPQSIIGVRRNGKYAGRVERDEEREIICHREER